MLKAKAMILGLAMAALLGESVQASVPRELQNKIVGVRLDDLVNTNPYAIAGLPNITLLIKKYPEYFFKQGKIETVHDVFFRQIPDDKTGETLLELTAFVKYKKDVFTFEKLTVWFTPGAVSLQELFIRSEVVYPLKDMMFRASVGLVDRKLIIEDDMKNIKLVFPIGVGSFDEGTMNEGKVSLLTPRFKNGFIDQREVISKRTKPRYFQGLPFVRISKGTDNTTDTTPIGFHVEINDSFVRGFDSHGCMRLREMDLMALHDLIVFGSQQLIPLTVQYRLNDLADSPIEKRNKMYKTVLNKGTAELPFFILDRDNLVQLTYKENTAAPVDKLIDNQRDNYHDLLSYETLAQLQEQEFRRKNECQSKVLSGQIVGDPKSFQACLDEGKNKDSLKDRIYRKYMGINDANVELPTDASLIDLL